MLPRSVVPVLPPPEVGRTPRARCGLVRTCCEYPSDTTRPVRDCNTGRRDRSEALVVGAPASDADKVLVGLTEVRLGIMPGAGGTQRLPRLVGEARAKELILLGRRITAARAAEIGLVHQAVPRDQLRPTVEGLLKELEGCAPLSLSSAKSAIQRGYGKPLNDALAIERECYDLTLYSEDRDEGLAAFAEGRPPKYLGR